MPDDALARRSARPLFVPGLPHELLNYDPLRSKESAERRLGFEGDRFCIVPSLLWEFVCRGKRSDLFITGYR